MRAGRQEPLRTRGSHTYMSGSRKGQGFVIHESGTCELVLGNVPECQGRWRQCPEIPGNSQAQEIHWTFVPGKHTHQFVWVPQNHWLDGNSWDKRACRGRKGHLLSPWQQVPRPYFPCGSQNKVGFSDRPSQSAAIQCWAGFLNICASCGHSEKTPGSQKQAQGHLLAEALWGERGSPLPSQGRKEIIKKTTYQA